MEKTREWYKPLTEWNSYCCMEFMSWVDNYSEGNPDLKLEDAVAAFRMVMDTGYCEETYTYDAKDRYAFGWTDLHATLNESLRKLVDEAPIVSTKPTKKKWWQK